MKIGFVDYVFNRQLPIGTDGLSEVVWNLAGPLAEQGHEVHIAGPYIGSIFPNSKVKVHSFELPFIGYRNIIGHILIVGKAIKVLQQFGPFDVFHAPEYLSTALLCQLQNQTPVVLTEPGNIYERIANGNPYDFVTTQFFKVAAHNTAVKCGAVIATSAEMGRWWKRTGTNENKIARIPLGVNLEGFTPVANARKQLGWSGQEKHLLFTARLSVETGAQYLLEAMPAILKVYPNVRLHIVGKGKFEEELHRIANRLKVEQALNWYGWVKLDELPAFYSATEAMVFPGTSGGTPRVMLQAMSCGAPFIGSAIGGITDHIEPGETGWLVPPRQPEALANAVIEVLDNPGIAQLNAERAKTYVNSLNWATVAEQIVQKVYLPLLQGKFVESSELVRVNSKSAF